MKILIIILLLAVGIGGMWYKGQLEGIVDQRPEQLGLPSIDQLPSMDKLHQHLLPEQRDLSQAIKEHQREAQVAEFIVQDAKVNPMSLEEAAKTGDIRAWAHSHQVQEEKSEIDKLMNFLARGKYE